VRCTAAITGDTHSGDWDGTVERREVKERNDRTIRIWKKGERIRIRVYRGAEGKECSERYPSK
jgi:hypothetical protein